MRQSVRIAGLLPIIAGLAGCLNVGPRSIADNRSFYNDVIIDTSSQQLLKNVVRVSQQEQPAFVDVQEINATAAFQSTSMGGVSNITALAAYVGSASNSITYNESPVVRYVPLSGNALIEQFGTPFTAANIVQLQSSGWSLSSILEFVINTITPSYTDNYRAVDILTTLDALGAITLEQSDKEPIIYIRFNGDGLLKPSLLKEVDPNDKSLDCLNRIGGQRVAPQLWAELATMLNQPGKNVITIVANQHVKGNIFSISTRSALGALKLASQNEFLFVDPDVAKSIRDANKYAACNNDNFYYRTSNEIINDAEAINGYWRQSVDNIANRDKHSARETAYRLGHYRAFVIIEKAREPSRNAYVSVFHKGFWYSIADDDVISKQNFSFISQLLTLKAQADKSKQSPTVIPVGGTLAIQR